MTTKSESKKMNKLFTCLTINRRDISEYIPTCFSEEIALMLPDDAMKIIAEQVGHDCVQQFQDSIYQGVKDYLTGNGFKEVKLFEHTIWIKGLYSEEDLDEIYDQLQYGESKKGTISGGGIWYHGCSE
jgi:hypothetical protein